MVRASSSRPAELDGDLYDDYALDLETGDAHETERPRVRERRRPAKGVVTVTVLLFAGALVWSIYFAGRPATALPDGHPDVSSMTAAPVAAATTPPALDEALAAELQAKVDADPNDLVSIRALADVYFRAEQFDTSASWLEKFAAARPDDLDSRLVLGVAYYNVQRFDDAKAQWLKATEISPTSAHPWYNLGFLCLSTDPPDIGAAEAAWNRVIELDPGSDLSSSVTEHLQRLQHSEAIGSPAPTA